MNTNLCVCVPAHVPSVLWVLAQACAGVVGAELHPPCSLPLLRGHAGGKPPIPPPSVLYVGRQERHGDLSQPSKRPPLWQPHSSPGSPTPPSLPRTQSHNTPWAAALWTALIAEHLLSQHQVQLPIIRSMTAFASPRSHSLSPERTVPAATHPGSRHSYSQVTAQRAVNFAPGTEYQGEEAGSKVATG